MNTAALIRGDAIAIPLRDESVDLVVTSPPYFALRSYVDGGEHYDGQIGSEPTPQDFLEALWAVTAECRRVLKPSGSMWVNLGDSYAGSGGYNNSAIGAGGRGPESYKKNRRGTSSESKEAQWTEADAAWLAGVIDSDGSISVRQFATGEGRSDSFVGWVRIGQMRPEVVKRAHEITGVGRVYQDKRGVWNWHATSQMAAYVLRRVWPWLYIKRRQALAVVELCRHTADVGASGGKTLTHDDIAYRATIREAVQDWNRDQPNDLEPPAIPRPSFDVIDPKPKSLHGLPWRYAIGCIDDLDLILRAEVIWSKPNGLPESVTDRVRRSHEQWFHFTKEPRYFAAVDEVREAHATKGGKSYADRLRDGQVNTKAKGNRGLDAGSVGMPSFARSPLGKLPGSVWTIPSEPLKVPDWLGVDHFAAFPQEWPRRIILGWSPSGICVECGQGRRPVVEKELHELHRQGRNRSAFSDLHDDGFRKDGGMNGRGESVVGENVATITGYACDCDQPTAPTRPAVVFDPFGGTSTVAMVARALGRFGVSMDLSRDYLRLAQWRVFKSGHWMKTVTRTYGQQNDKGEWKRPPKREMVKGTMVKVDDTVARCWQCGWSTSIRSHRHGEALARTHECAL